MSEIIELFKPVLSERKSEIDEWFKSAYKTTWPLFYCSVDLRHSGHKLAPVDTNLFPAGFNNLSDSAKLNATSYMKEYFEKYMPDTKNVLLVPENHTRNLYYLENVFHLKELIEKAGINVVLGGLQTDSTTKLQTQSGKDLVIEPIERKDDIVFVENLDFTPDMVIVNNDLSSGAPEILKDISQTVVPPVGLGWYKRRKTTHFESYSNIAQEFCQEFGLDPWLITTSFHRCGQINFQDKQGLECVSLGVEKVLHKVQKKYDEHNIKENPYVFIKANNGTYGMGIMTVHSGQEIMEINKKIRKKMSVIKEGVVNSDVIIQEGVPTIDRIGDKVAEPMMYLIGGKSVGCSYRINENRDEYGNLNSPGVEFKSACEGDQETGDEKDILCPVQALIARLAALAASKECYEPKWEI